MAILDFLKSTPSIGFKELLSSGFGNTAEPTTEETEKRKQKTGTGLYYYTIGDQVKKLPFIHQAADLKARIIFSQGITFTPKDKGLLDNPSEAIQRKVDEDKEKLEMLLGRKNELYESISELLYTTIINTELYGHAGLQAYDWESPEKLVFRSIDWNQFFIVVNKLKKEDKGRQKILYFLINLLGAKDEAGLEQLLEDASIGVQGQDEYKYKVIPQEFVFFKLNTESAYGVSPLYYDQLTKQLLLDSLNDNIAEVNNQGFKGMIIKGRAGISPRELGLARDSDEMKGNWVQTIVEKYMKELRKVISGNKNRENIVYIPGALADGVEKLERNIRSTDYLGFIQAKGAVLAASMLGIHPGFLGEKDSTYASNLSEAIKFAVTYSIEPSQQRYESIINTQIMDRYINGTGWLNYDYHLDIKEADTADKDKESQILDRLGNFIIKLKQEGVMSGNEGARFINTQEVNGLEISEDENYGEDKTTIRPLYPVEFKDVEDTDKE